MTDTPALASNRFGPLVRKGRLLVWIVLAVALAVAPFAYALGPAALAVGVGVGLAMGVTLALLSPPRGAGILGIGGGIFVGLWAAAALSWTDSIGLHGPGIPPLIVAPVAVGVMDGMSGTAAKGLREGARLTGWVCGALLLAMVPSPYPLPIIAIMLVICALLLTVCAGLSPTLLFARPRREATKRLLAASILILLAVTSLGWLSLIDTRGRWSPAMAQTSIIAIGVPTLFLLGRLIAAWLRPRLTTFEELGRYLRVMWIPLGSFTLGYLAIIVVFAGFYSALFRHDTTEFGDAAAGWLPDLPHWLYFSLSTAATLDAEIHPMGAAARFLVGLQVIVCTGWTVAVFAAVTAHLQPRFSDIAAKLTGQRS